VPLPAWLFRREHLVLAEVRQLLHVQLACGLRQQRKLALLHSRTLSKKEKILILEQEMDEVGLSKRVRADELSQRSHSYRANLQ